MTTKKVSFIPTIPAKPGPLTLGYPKWIPGEHSPAGALNQIIKLKFSSNGHALQWRRDDVEIYDFRLNIPADVTELNIDLDFASVDMSDGFSATVTTSEHIAIVNWWQLVLFPTDISADKLMLQSRLLLPRGWRCGTALPIQRESAGQMDFAPVSLRVLID
jgi:predicted metalloprotease with PDZ domain